MNEIDSKQHVLFVLLDPVLILSGKIAPYAARRPDSSCVSCRRAMGMGFFAFSTSTRPIQRSRSNSGKMRHTCGSSPRRRWRFDTRCSANGAKIVRSSRPVVFGSGGRILRATPPEARKRQQNLLPERRVEARREEADHLPAGLQNAEEFIDAHRVRFGGVVKCVPGHDIKRTVGEGQSRAVELRKRSGKAVACEVVRDNVRVFVRSGRDGDVGFCAGVTNGVGAESAA